MNNDILCSRTSNSRSTSQKVELLLTNTQAGPNSDNVSGQPGHWRMVSDSAKSLIPNAPASTSATQIEDFLRIGRPEFFPRPVRGIDPFFGLTKWTYNEWSRLGLLRLVRVRQPGNVRGKVLVPYDDVTALLRKLQNDGGNRE